MTVGLGIELSVWVDPENGVGAVVHEVGVNPQTPVWEAVGWVNGGDCFAVHPPSPPTEAFPQSGNRTEVTYDLADAGQQLVQVVLWQRGLDPTWPRCPEHHGQHPLRPAIASLTTDGDTSARSTETGQARWECPLGHTSIPIGELQPAQQ